MRRFVSTVALLAAAACGGARPPPAAFPVGEVAVDGDPNGLLWDEGGLLIADSAANRILRWDGRSPPSVYAEIPAAGRPGVGQLGRLADGRILVSRFGYGEKGSMFVVDRAK